MIDPKEIRIGNYLHGSHQESEEVLEVAGISKSTDWLIFYTRISDGAKHLNPNSFFSPIPLTEDWLIKFGFRKQAHSFIGEKFNLSEWDSFPLNWCVAMNKNNSIIVDKLKFVHQLQNLYFALTRQELIYNENHK